MADITISRPKANFNRRLLDKSGPDFYPTPTWGTEALLRYENFLGEVLEPCCGNGAMADVMKAAGYVVIASDLHYRDYGDRKDFFDIWDDYPNIVTNPPFSLAEDMLEHALALAKFKVCFLLRTAFLESKRRYERFFKKRPPARVLVFTERLSMYPEGYEIKSGGTTSYSWFVWDKAVRYQEPVIRWIEPRFKNG